LVVGVIAASVKQLGELTRLVRGAGYEVAIAVESRPGEIPPMRDLDVWIVNLDVHDELARPLFEMLEATGALVIYEEDLQITAASVADEGFVSAAQMRQQKERRLAAKLRQLVRKPLSPDTETETRRARAVWVIGASTGGPEAISEFVQAIPADLTGVALIYAQHMEAHGFENLCAVIAKHSHWRLAAIDAAMMVREQTVYVVSPEWQFELSEGGVISPLAAPWGGRCRPCIDQVIAKVAKVYRDRSGAIIFSGMGDDGASSSRFMFHLGGKIWVQTPSSCALDSMPVSVEKNGCVSFIGEPLALAKHFVQLHRH
jgi:chemosensory pili system protein ChpB (putative protein-glutamate methylesterase)